MATDTYNQIANPHHDAISKICTLEDIKIQSWNIAKNVNWYFLVALIMLTMALTMGTAILLTESINEYLNQPDQLQAMEHINDLCESF